ncbi:hypothetical protein CP556_25055 [Natrinema sp. CBA1119]|nr:hypothetical protein CP556_25055 [Natrinema sp. CBA1119]
MRAVVDVPNESGECRRRVAFTYEVFLSLPFDGAVTMQNRYVRLIERDVNRIHRLAGDVHRIDICLLSGNLLCKITQRNHAGGVLIEDR